MSVAWELIDCSPQFFQVALRIIQNKATSRQRMYNDRSQRRRHKLMLFTERTSTVTARYKFHSVDTGMFEPPQRKGTLYDVSLTRHDICVKE